MSKTQKFEQALKRLEEIVSRMESGDLELDKSLALFEEGVTLVRFCSGKLDEAKKKVEILVNKNGTMIAEPFSADINAHKDDSE
jgi:exodeoxyribonuclease VII small subunit